MLSAALPPCYKLNSLDQRSPFVIGVFKGAEEGLNIF